MNTLWLPLLLSSVIWAEEQYFPQSRNATWDEGRLHCKSCFKELTTITSRNVHLIVQNLSSDYWVGLRKSYNDSIQRGEWPAWSNGDPVTYQNWYPGHPVPFPICSSTTQSPLSTPMTSTQASTVTSASVSSKNDTCPILSEMLLCLNMTCGDLESAMGMCKRTPTVTPKTTTYSTSFNAPTTGTTTESTSNCKPNPGQYIKDACVVLLSSGMWKEKDCNISLPFICYEERFFGQINISDVTTSAGNLSWSEGPGAENISHYRVEVTGDKNQTFNQTKLFQYIENLTAGTLYKVQVFPVKCGRDLNPQNISFYTYPSDVQNLIVVSVTNVSANLKWSKPDGNHESYSVYVKYKSNKNVTERVQECQDEECTITALIPGTEYVFTVTAVVNKTIEGVPSNVSNYTIPSTVRNLRSADNDSTVIMAFWDPPTGNHSGYRYCLKEVNNSRECTYCNIASDSSITANNNITNSSDTTTVSIADCKTVDGTETFIKVTNKSDGSMFCLCVAALTKTNTLSGEMVTILAYTKPKTVTLFLNPSSQTIFANWTVEGKYEKFEVSITTDAYIYTDQFTTPNLNYSFKDLKAGVNYNVSVVTLNGKLRSNPANKSEFTRPAKPCGVKATTNKTTIQVSWEAPTESEGASIKYTVKCYTAFWEKSHEVQTPDRSISFTGLNPGTRYECNVSVVAGNLESFPETVHANTVPEKRKLVLTMLCSSKNSLHCGRNETRFELFEKLKNITYDKFQDLVHWKLSWAKTGNNIL
ncbi:receptor-type tyrosine-protein phosphatase eta-like isoform X2 [Cyprinus carpio]|uniref:Receptor-type tyrosine-protein phosphatase eta-like isoform X1 n=2 Tax=Cyprinus carpio TaxID=7962 RepID=A0A9Q9VT84_CYPCA|nr:receptor-type tyrosine-protein phosphatase eta-like isoform X1 [Cyprinus carpio]XP_042570764.1 receptor-type tyrosine-protein phosphatase eta-like isoform X2 [Cyprinus carpio]